MLKTTSAFAFVLLTLTAVTASATVTFDWATVGHPNNPPDQLYTDSNPDNLQFGSVSYAYRISKYEVTNQQYIEFLNAVDPMGTNPNGVYNNSMSSNARGGIAFAAGAAAGSKYSLKTNMGDKPVNYVSFIDSMRFVNWLENGQPTGGGGTGNGVYTIDDGIRETRAAGATYFIPSENEWYKAAYYQPAAVGGDTDGYWLYATKSNTATTIATANATGDISNPGTNVANFNFGANWNGQSGNVTTVGSASAGSAGFYGTFDQMGNVYEWNEALLGDSRGFRGGDWLTTNATAASASARASGAASFDFFGNVGFRVASAAELPGDYNHTGTVDAADYVVWRKTGINGPQGYNDWRSHFGQKASSGSDASANAAVPEPSAVLLGSLAGLSLLWRRQR